MRARKHSLFILAAFLRVSILSVSILPAVGHCHRLYIVFEHDPVGEHRFSMFSARGLRRRRIDAIRLVDESFRQEYLLPHVFLSDPAKDVGRGSGHASAAPIQA